MRASKRWATLFVLVLVAMASAATAQPSTSAFRVNTYTRSYQRWPRVAPIVDIWYAVVWTSNPQVADDGFGVYGKRVTHAGAALGSEFRVTTYTPGSQGEPDVASDLTGNFVVVWT